MPVRIRLQRQGARHRPFFRIVVADGRSKRNGQFIETIGYFDPISDPSKLEIQKDRAVEWLKKGAVPSDSVKNLLDKEKISIS